MDELKILPFAKGINYIAPTEDPLSANVVMIEGRDFYWIFDVGDHPGIPERLNALPKPRKLVLSHFHRDHIGNYAAVDCEEIYEGRQTFKYTGKGTVVEQPLEIRDGDLRLKILPLPSSHAKGSLALEVNGTYLLLGDGAYAMDKNGQMLYNAGLLQAEIELLETTEAPWFLLSHQEPFRHSRRAILLFLRCIYADRKPDEPYITAKNQ